MIVGPGQINFRVGPDHWFQDMQSHQRLQEFMYRRIYPERGRFYPIQRLDERVREIRFADGQRMMMMMMVLWPPRQEVIEVVER